MRTPPNRTLLAIAGILAVVGVTALALVALTGTPPPESPAPGASRSSVAVGARFAKAGDCVVNDGTGDAPVLRLVSCGPGAFVVLARVEGMTDADQACAGVVGYQYKYSYESPLDRGLDFVLCLKSAGD